MTTKLLTWAAGWTELICPDSKRQNKFERKESQFPVAHVELEGHVSESVQQDLLL